MIQPRHVFWSRVCKRMSNDRSYPTRRRVLQGSAGTLASTMLQTRLARAAGSPGSVIPRLSSYMSEAKDRNLPPNVIEKARRHILDTFAAMISGSELPPGRAAIKFAASYGGEKIATVAASKVLCGPIEAALASGVLAHADETDDSWPSGWHPGCNVTPAALAGGEQFGISGGAFRPRGDAGLRRRIALPDRSASGSFSNSQEHS
jgi:hypothetical protein